MRASRPVASKLREGTGYNPEATGLGGRPKLKDSEATQLGGRPEANDTEATDRSRHWKMQESLE